MWRCGRLVGGVVFGVAVVVGATVGLAGGPEDSAAPREKGSILRALGRSFADATVSRLKGIASPRTLGGARAVVEGTPSDPYAYAQRAYRHATAENYEAALADCSRALRLDSDFEYALVLRASVLLSLKRPDEAIRDFDRLANEFDVPRACVLGGKAAAYLIKRDYAAATEHLRQAIAATTSPGATKNSRRRRSSTGGVNSAR